MAPADVAAHVQRRVKRIAEQAFWDSVQATLAESGAGVSQQQVTGQLAGLLAHMGQELMAVLPEQARAAREQLAAELDEGRLQEALTAHQVSANMLLCPSQVINLIQATLIAMRQRTSAACNSHGLVRIICITSCLMPLSALLT